MLKIKIKKLLITNLIGLIIGGTEMGYLFCENCKEEFELDPDENKENFDSKCDECGGKLKYIEESSLGNVKFCPECESKNEDDAKFCKNCGKDFSVSQDVHEGVCPFCAEKINPRLLNVNIVGNGWIRKRISPSNQRRIIF